MADSRPRHSMTKRYNLSETLINTNRLRIIVAIDLAVVMNEMFVQ